MDRVLVVDDLAKMRSQIGSALAALGAELLEAADGVEALEVLSSTSADLVVTDVRMPRMDGLELLQALRDRGLPVILHSGFQDVEAAVKGVQLGAVDFFPTPIDFTRLRKRAEDCLRRESRSAGTLVGRSPQLARVRSLVSRIAQERSPVLITGETGVGKQLVARALHAESPRREGPFVPIELSALNAAGEAGLEDFTERVASAHGGTVVLGEISNASAAQQAGLVRLLKTTEDGEPRDGPDVRVLATTRRDLTRRVADGQFREDLWYRISGLRVHVPPLRERRADADALIALELERLSSEHSGPPFQLDEEGYARLRRHSWPGNVIELQSALRRLAILAGDRRLLDCEDAEAALRIVEVESKPRAKFESRERSNLVEVLDSHYWNVSATARDLGMSRGRLRGLMTKLGLV